MGMAPNGNGAEWNGAEWQWKRRRRRPPPAPSHPSLSQLPRWAVMTGEDWRRLEMTGPRLRYRPVITARPGGPFPPAGLRELAFAILGDWRPAICVAPDSIGPAPMVGERVPLRETWRSRE
eukprot:gene15765-biopygen13538